MESVSGIVAFLIIWTDKRRLLAQGGKSAPSARIVRCTLCQSPLQETHQKWLALGNASDCLLLGVALEFQSLAKPVQNQTFDVAFAKIVQSLPSFLCRLLLAGVFHCIARSSLAKCLTQICILGYFARLYRMNE
eukprot:5118490-Amphidinium_carterae.1